MIKLSLFLCLVILNAINGQFNNGGLGYDSRYFKHGSSRNEYQGGTCKEFLEINNRNQCCANRDDDCYMIHYDTRCYCDVFCDRSQIPDNSDCCPDAYQMCRGVQPPPPPPPTQRPSRPPIQPTPPPTQIPENCWKDGKYYRNGESFKENCHDCYCQDGRVECSRKECLVNLDLMNQINQDPSSTWRADNYSMFWGKPLEYGYKHRLGAKVINKNSRPLVIDNEPIQERYDFREEPFMVDNIRSDYIRDQGDCGASWAFSALDAATDRISKVYEGKRGNETMSVQMIISCAILPDNANGCSPATMDQGWRFIESVNKDADGKIVGGIVNEKCYPYESGSTGFASECKVNPNSNRIVCPSDNRVYNKPLMNSGPGYFLKTYSTNDIMEDIQENGPIQVAFKVYDDFFMYKSGVYSKHPNAKLADVEHPYHAVKVLGWGTENGVDYWLAANSWGTQWGENGYFKIKRDDDETEFGRHIYAAWASRAINTKNKNKNHLGRKNKQRFVNIQRKQ